MCSLGSAGPLWNAGFSSMPLALTVENLAVERGGRVLFSNLFFRTVAGEAMTLTGPNGAGKTTLLRALAGFCRLAAGSVVLAEAAGERDMAENCHFIGHTNAVKPALSVWENAVFWARYLGGDAAPVRPTLERFQLADLAHVPAGYLSAGQKRRLALARLLLAPRPLWLLDEPTVSLDTASTAILARAIDDHVAGGGIVLAATHIPLGVGRVRELRLGGRAAKANFSEPR
jgi:heme exporter protein A